MPLKWYHFPHHEPPEAIPLYVRNWPWPGVHVRATYGGGSSGVFICIGTNWVFPAQLAYQFALAPDPLPVPPQPPALPNRVWRDCVLYQPADQQLCWVRALSPFAAPFKAVFQAGGGGGDFVPVELEVCRFAWCIVSLWRPASS
jgi:hypothetical protein